MGIPKFYRWLSERYPLLNQKLTLTEGPPEMDNLYLDMNGIIHNCTHANRKDIGSVTEEDMMLKVFTYLEKLVQIVRPQKLLFMAIDGVAPRAKMNQQRSRRFKSAMERLKNEEEQRRKGETVPEDAFDSNCITPGTAFMARLGQHLRFFIRRKMAEDPLWQKPTVVFSGHEVPGEGEHKIMEYIRWEKRQHTYQPNQRHCMYGLDADLIMLSLVTHEPHFCLLREVVSYTGMNRGQPAREVLDNPCAESFILFQIGLLREYFELEFGNIKLPFALDIERIIDDYVLMCMLVGNDFLPALPTLDIAEGALNKLMDIYKELLPKLGGYLTYAGDLDRRRLEVLVQRIGQMELETLEERAQDAEFMESKRAKRAARSGGPRMQLNELDAGMRSMAGSHGGVRAAALDQPLEPDTPKSVLGGAPAAQQGPTMMSREARQMMMAGLGDQGLQMWKDRYYNEKLHAVSPEERREVMEHYVAGLHWVLEYYYRGVASWDWYYPYHYAPMASDLVNLESIQVVALKDPKFVNPDFAVIHAPLALTPVPFPRARFELAQQAMPLFNALVDAVAADETYLEATLRPAAAHDAFTGRLLACLTATRTARAALRGAGREVVLGVHRSDYMLDQPSGKFLQVELNTIASSFGCLSALMTRLHAYIASRADGLDLSRLPANPALDDIPDAIAAAATASGHREAGGVVVMVVQPGERNAYDQQWIQLQLWERHRLRTVRMTLADIAATAQLDEATGTVKLSASGGASVCVFYFRAGYTPTDYPTEAEWVARELIERSNAAKCPTVAYQLAGTKKVQQDLAAPGVLERFVADPQDAALLREFFAGLWSLDPVDLAHDPAAAAAVADALARPEAYVLKPQREGGGNNMYGEELQAALRAGAEELSAFILMQRILPPVNRSVLVRNGQWAESETLSELGIYGTFIRHNDTVLLSKQSGHLVRTKTSSSNEGGVAAGFAVLDSPYLVN